MALNKRQYTDGQTIITAANLNEIQDCIITLEGNYVPKTRTVAGKALSSNITLAASDVGAVPTSRTVNSKALSSNITLSAADVGAVPVSRTVNSKALSSNITLNYADVGAVPSTRTVNGKALSDNITITASDIGAVPTSRTINSKALTSNITLSAADVSAVPTTRTVNSKALSSNITLSAADVGAVPTSRKVNNKALSSDITLAATDIGYGSSNVGATLTSKLPHLTSTGDTTDRLAEINAALAQGGCVLGEGTFYISDTIVMPNNASLIGCGVNTVISLVSSATNKSAIKMAQFNTIENLKLYGAKSATSTIGNVHGIEWSGDYSTSTNPYKQPRLGKISNVYIDSFSGGGIYCNNTGYEYYTNLNVDNVTIYSCCVGIYIPYWSEYHKFTNVHTWNCFYGCINNGGNNSFVNCDFSGSKEIGFKIENPNNANPNNTHGMCVGCLFNHIKNNTGDAVVISDTHNGFAFVGCQFFYGNISISNTTGIVFDGCTCSAISITVTGTGANIFSNNTFYAQPTVNVTSATVFDNCYERTTNKPISPFVKEGKLTAATGITLYEDYSVRQIGKIVFVTCWFRFTAASSDLGRQRDVATISGVDLPPIVGNPQDANRYIRGTIAYGAYAYAVDKTCYGVIGLNPSNVFRLAFTPIEAGEKSYVVNMVYLADLT